jgi:hypothetical protein
LVLLGFGNKMPPKGYNNPLEASYRHLLETPFIIFRENPFVFNIGSNTE